MLTKLIKLAFIDTETTGLNPVLNDPFQVAVIFRKLVYSYLGDGVFEFALDKELEEKVFYLKPLNFDTISLKALEVNGVSIETLKSYPPAAETFNEIISYFNTKVDGFNKSDKLIPVGYNVKFDLDFLFALQEKIAFKFLGSYLSRKTIDVLDHFRHLSLIFPDVFSDSISLKNVCGTQGVCVPLDLAHDALADIRATMELFSRFMLPQLLAAQSCHHKILGGLTNAIPQK
jgi:DNA polymerase III epsilon subunit-like protein